MSDQPDRPKPLQNQESVWDYPRPPRVEAFDKPVRVVFNGMTIAEAKSVLRVLETSHPPVYYIPREAVRTKYLLPSSRQTVCEFKGASTYWTIKVGDRLSMNAAWSYEQPYAGYEALAGHLAFYASRVDACYVDDERVTPQQGEFYGGWITSNIVGPFKGAPGTQGW
jgi:uncharacterized protein (DUF427 family)